MILGSDGKPVVAKGKKKSDKQIYKGNKDIDLGYDPAQKIEAMKRKDREIADLERKILNEPVNRGQVIQLVEGLDKEITEQIRLLFVQVRTLTELIISKDLATLDELDELSKPIYESLYGKRGPEKEEKEEEDSSNTK